MGESNKSEQPKKALTKRQRAFLAAYAQLGNITGAAEAANTARTQHYEWMRSSVTYCECFAQAEEEAADRLEAEARRRAVDGVEEPVFQGGKQVGTIRKYSDNLLMFLAKGARPQKFKDRHEHTGANNGPIKTELGINLSLLSDADIAKELQKLELLNAGGNGEETTAIEGTENSTL